MQERPESLGARLCHRFSEMLLFGTGGSDSEPDTAPRSDGGDGGDGSGTHTGPITNSVVIIHSTAVPETTEEGYISSPSPADSEATLVLPTHDSTPAAPGGPEVHIQYVFCDVAVAPAKRGGLVYELIATNLADVVELGHRWPAITYLPSLTRL